MRVRLGDSRLNVTLGKRYTPVRTQIPTGMSKAEYNQLVDDVANLSASVQSLTNRTSALEDNIAAAQANIQDIVKKIDSLKNGVVTDISDGTMWIGGNDDS